MDLETTFYILGIIFMSLMLLIMIGITIAVFVIRAKINAIHRQIEEKLQLVSTWAHVAQNVSSEFVNTAKKAKKAVTGQ